MNNTELETLCFIQEQTSFTEDYSQNFGYEEHNENGRLYVVFEAVLQSFGIRNRNGREYDEQNVWNCIQTDVNIQDYLRRNSWVGECDHPAAKINGQELTTDRIAVPDMAHDSHYIRSPRLENHLLVANIQTDSGTAEGMNMAIKIVDGKIIPCFSARVFGALQKRGGRNIVMVRKLITYDWVLFPSHPEAEARITQKVVESANDAEQITGVRIIYFPELARMAANSSKETEFLCESFGLDINSVVGLTETGNSVVVQENANTYIQPLSDRIIRRKTKSMLNDWLNK